MDRVADCLEWAQGLSDVDAIFRDQLLQGSLHEGPPTSEPQDAKVDLNDDMWKLLLEVRLLGPVCVQACLLLSLKLPLQFSTSIRVRHMLWPVGAASCQSQAA